MADDGKAVGTSLVNTAMHCAATGVVVRGSDRPLSGDEITTASVAEGSISAGSIVDLEGRKRSEYE